MRKIQLVLYSIVWITLGIHYTSAWSVFNGFEYELYADTTGKNWHDARADCFSKGGDLSSILSQAENAFLLGLTTFNGKIWVGYNRLAGASDYQWSDGQALNYLHWSSGSPINNPVMPMKCVYISRTVSGWTNQHCDNLAGYVCKRPDDGSNHTPKPPPSDNEVPGYCPAGYFTPIGGSNKCYKVVRVDQENEGMTWVEASRECRRGPGFDPDIASIANSYENDAILAQFNDDAIHGVWIGLHIEPINEPLFKWSDNSPLAYTNWGPGEPSSPYAEMCVELWVAAGPAGTWNDNNCDMYRGYVCQTFKDPNNVIPTPGPTPASNCPPGYTLSGYACYKISDDPMSWELAATFGCETDGGGQLVSIHSPAEYAAINLYLASVPAPLTTLIWIGLKFDQTFSVYYWNDNWHVTFTKWAAGQPNRDPTSGGCVARKGDGTWTDDMCLNQYNFLCKYTTATPRTTAPPMEGTCPKNSTSHTWYPYGGYCYAPVIFNSRTWDLAQNDCLNSAGGANLVSIHEPLENLFVGSYFSSSGPDSYWIGMSKPGAYMPYEWRDGSEVEYTSWNVGEPNNVNQSTQNCVRVIKNTQSFRWDDTTCSNMYPYMCKVAKKPLPTTPVPPSSIPGGCPNYPCPGSRAPNQTWTQYGGDCYLFCPDSWHTWDEAVDECSRFGAFLTVISDDVTNWFVHTSLIEKTNLWYSRMYWIGLYKPAGIASNYTWVDGTSVSYSRWLTEDPPRDREQLCGHLSKFDDESTDYLLWNAQGCNVTMGFSCRTEKFIVIPTTSPPKVSSGGVDGGMVAGVLIAVVLILLAGGGGYVYVKRSGARNPRGVIESLGTRVRDFRLPWSRDNSSGIDNVVYEVSEDNIRHSDVIGSGGNQGNGRRGVVDSHDGDIGVLGTQSSYLYDN